MKRLNNLQDKLLKLFTKKNRALYMTLLKVISKNINNKDIKIILNKEIVLLYEKQKELINDTLSYSYIVLNKDKRRAYKILKENWNDKHYSERLYKDKIKLKKTLLRELSKNINEKDNEETIKRVSKRLDVSINNARRLVNTEMTAVINRAEYDKAIKDKKTRFKFKAIIDDRTSDICRELNDEIFDIKDFKIGVNAGPIHPNCRSRVEFL